MTSVMTMWRELQILGIVRKKIEALSSETPEDGKCRFSTLSLSKAFHVVNKILL